VNFGFLQEWCVPAGTTVLVTVPATDHPWSRKRRAIHQWERGIQQIALALVQAGTIISDDRTKHIQRIAPPDGAGRWSPLRRSRIRTD